MIEVLRPSDLPRARATGRLVADILQTLKARSAVGTNLLELDRLTARLIDEAGAQSCYVDYAPSFGRGPFAHHVCTSVNDAVLHGRPHDYALAAGDLVSLDLAVSLDGIVADSAISFVVEGDGGGAGAGATDLDLIATTERALAAAVDVVRPGARVGDLSHAIGQVVKGAGYRVNTQFGGHGVGTTMHQDPHIANDGRPGRGYTLRPGLLLAIEPWVMADTDELVTDADGWTLRSATGCRTAHSEHTVAVTESGVEVLTLPSGAAPA
ncbi:methionyl aminopeptidase [Terracoccus luteus]|jgi:methionyl aminopeptidase|uniref:Methionine aminopeptidase n=1 Tax=Terracoccus luteus TaxID=53356 RepID=A0A495XQS3_9MICO|nr:type I methionyl aminopeptidase [Terracoccus luteus]RKT76870.1 methionyl aminopeptidase [Terracoccus luteus]